MYCPNCGAKIQNGSKFCSECGSPISQSNAQNTTKLRCEDCNGVMDVDPDREIISCPYCGSKHLVLDSDAVKIERIRGKSKVAIAKENSRAAVEIEAEKAKQSVNEKKIGTIMIAILAILCIFIFSLMR